MKSLPFGLNLFAPTLTDSFGIQAYANRRRTGAKKYADVKDTESGIITWTDVPSQLRGEDCRIDSCWLKGRNLCKKQLELESAILVAEQDLWHGVLHTLADVWGKKPCNNVEVAILFESEIDSSACKARTLVLMSRACFSPKYSMLIRYSFIDEANEGSEELQLPCEVVIQEQASFISSECIYGKTSTSDELALDLTRKGTLAKSAVYRLDYTIPERDHLKAMIITGKKKLNLERVKVRKSVPNPDLDALRDKNYAGVNPSALQVAV